MSLQPRTTPESLSSIHPHDSGHRSRSPKCRSWSTGTQIPYHQENGPKVDIILVHGLQGATEKTWRARESTVFWPRDLIPYELRPGNGRIMTFGYNANVMQRNLDSSKINNLEGQNLLALSLSTATRDVGYSEGRMHRPSVVLDRKFDGRRDPVQRGHVEKHYQVLSHCWGQQEIAHRETIVTTKTHTCKDASYTGQDNAPRDSYNVNIRQFIGHHNRSMADSPNYSEIIGSPRYRRLLRVLGSLINPAVVLSYPMTVSAAALSWKFDHRKNGIFPSSSHRFRIQMNLTKK